MYKLICCVAVALVAVSFVASDSDEFGDSEFVPFVGLRRDVFDWNLLKAIARNETGNFVISPFSIKLILMLLTEMSGINSETRRELLTSLDNITDVAQGREIFRNYLQELNKPDSESTVKCGSRVYVTDKLRTSQKLGAIFESEYNAQIKEVDFEDADGVTSQINSWVSELTNAKIPNFLTKADVVDTVVMLLNAVYFEGNWKKPFLKERTEMDNFQVPAGRGVQNVRVEFMHDRGEYYYFYSKKLKAKLLRIPYAGKHYAMYILLPFNDSNIDTLVQSLDSKLLHAEAWYMDEYEVDVKLPKFRINYPVGLKGYFQQLGINSIFSADASLGGLARGQQVTSNQLIVTAILHKAGIEVNEEGTVAFAATEAQLVNKIGGGVKKFNVDRPFFFYIEQETTGNIVFAGKITDPTKFGEAF